MCATAAVVRKTVSSRNKPTINQGKVDVCNFLDCLTDYPRKLQIFICIVWVQYEIEAVGFRIDPLLAPNGSDSVR